MTSPEPARAVACQVRPRVRTLPETTRQPEITAYGCGRHEADLFREVGARLGAVPTITDAALSVAIVELARGNRCISVGHKTVISHETLLQLHRTGVEYISTRSIGLNHIDVTYAKRLGLSVEAVAYSPDSVADYTVMLMLMGLRHVKSTRRIRTGLAGVGLGLAIVKSITQAQEGTLTLTARAAGGLCATVQLPVATLDSRPTAHRSGSPE